AASGSAVWCRRAPLRGALAGPSPHAGLLGPHQDASTVVATDDLIGGRRLDLVEFGGAQRELAPLTAAITQRCGSHIVVLVTQLVIHGQQVGGDLGGDSFSVLGEASAVPLDTGGDGVTVGDGLGVLD